MTLLTAIPALSDLALLVFRLVAGGMFALSGFFKLTQTERREKMRHSLAEAHIPPALAPLVSLVELLGGTGVVLGGLTALAASGLLAVSLGALLLTTLPKAKGEGIHKLETILYSPEALLAAGLLMLIGTGAGQWSLDALLFAMGNR